MSNNTVDLLMKMRRGYQMEHTMKYGEAEFQVRLLKADEEIQIATREKEKGSKDNLPKDKVSLNIQKGILRAASTLPSTGDQSIPDSLLAELTVSEIEALYGRYLNILNEVDRDFQELDYETIQRICNDVKKKKQKARDISTRHLAEIGIFFLEEWLPLVKDAGQS